MGFGIVVGIVLLLITMGTSHGKRPSWVYKWLRSSSLNGDAGFQSKLRTAFSGTMSLNDLRMLKPLIVVFIGFMGSLVLPVDTDLTLFLGGLIGGYMVLAGATLALGMRDKERRQVALFAAERAALRLKPQLAEELLIPLAADTWTGGRVAAIAGLRMLGTGPAYQALQRLQSDREGEVAKAATAAIDDLRRLTTGETRIRVLRGIAPLCDEYAALHASVDSKSRNKAKKKKLERLEEVVRELDERVFTQTQFRRAFPDVYCKQCLSRANRFSYEHWEWVECKVCKEAMHLVAGARIIVGQVDGDEDWEIRDQILRFPIWNDMLHKATSAELDTIRVVAGKDVNYDWAVNAVLDKVQLREDKNRPSFVIEEGVVLEPNTWNLLRVYDPRIKPPQP